MIRLIKLEIDYSPNLLNIPFGVFWVNPEYLLKILFSEILSKSVWFKFSSLSLIE